MQLEPVEQQHPKPGESALDAIADLLSVNGEAFVLEEPEDAPPTDDQSNAPDMTPL